jgi:sarcosine oxidase
LIYDVIIVGAGMTGSACAYELAKRGQKVLLLEQFTLAHERGSSHGHSRIVRTSYDHADYVRMMQRALVLWRDLERDAGIPLFIKTGILDMGPKDSRRLQLTRNAMREAGEPFENLTPSEVTKRYPQWRLPNDWEAIYSPNAGSVNATKVVETLNALALNYGVTLLEHTAVTEIAFDTEPKVITEGKTYQAKKIIVAAGAWLSKLFPEFTSRLRVTQEAVAYVRPLEPSQFTPETFPVFIEDETYGIYGFPMLDYPGVKLAYHLRGHETTPDGKDDHVSEKILLELQEFLRQHVPKAAGQLVLSKTCLYTNTVTEDFLLDTHPECASVFLASPCSGHGFKFAPLLGELVADVVTKSEHPFWLERFRLHNILPFDNHHSKEAV